MSNGQNNPNQGNQKGGRDDQKHAQNEREQSSTAPKGGQKRQPVAPGGAVPVGGGSSGRTAGKGATASD